MKKRLTFNSILWILNSIALLMLMLSWLAFYSPLEELIVISFFGLAVPALVLINSIFFLYWLVKRKRKAFVVSIVLLVSFICFGRFYGTGSEETSANETDFSIMSYNIRGLNINEQLPIKDVDSAIYDFVASESPDIFCVQESHKIMKRKSPLDDIYSHKFIDYIYGIPKTEVINSVYSKFPILDYKVIDFPKSYNKAIYVDVLIKKDTVRIYNVHLQSFRVIPNVAFLQNKNSGILYNRITKAIQMQEEQVGIILEDMKSCAYPKLLVGDFNNVQFSKVYRALKRGHNDSFLEGGSGFGGTYELFGLPLRIDYIFADSHFEFTYHNNYAIELSDHYPIKAGVRLKVNK